MSEDFATCLTYELPVTLLFDDLSLGDLRLLVGLLDIASDLPPMDDILARGGIGLVHGEVGGRLCLLTLPRVFTLSHRSRWRDFRLLRCRHLPGSLLLEIVAPTVRRHALLLRAFQWLILAPHDPNFSVLPIAHKS